MVMSANSVMKWLTFIKSDSPWKYFGDHKDASSIPRAGRDVNVNTKIAQRPSLISD